MFVSPKFAAVLLFAPLILAILPAGQGDNTVDSAMTYQIKTTWDGLPVDHEPITISLIGRGDKGVEIRVRAPFFGLPGNPGGKPGEPFDKLWNYEVVEVFFADGDPVKPKYLEVELCPWGQHLVLILDGIHNAVRTLLPLEFQSSIEEDEYWHGTALVPSSYFPPRVTRFNAYAIHDVKESQGEDPRRYESLFPAPTGEHEAADFHRLEYFQPLDFESIQPGNCNASLSDPWPQERIGRLGKQDEDSKLINVESVVRVQLKAKNLLLGGTVTNGEEAIMTIEGVSTFTAADVRIMMTAKFLDTSAMPNGSRNDPLVEMDLNKYQTLRVYLANSDRRFVELVFSPNGQYDVRIYHAPYQMISQGHRLQSVNVELNETEATWKVTTEVPLYFLPAHLNRFNFALVYTENNAVTYETGYSLTNNGISLPDLYVIGKYPGKKELLKPILNEGYSEIWEED